MKGLSTPFVITLLCFGGGVLILAAWTVFNAALVDPIQRTSDRITTLAQELVEFRIREANLTAETAEPPGTGQPTSPVLVSATVSAAVSAEAFQEAIRNEITAVHGASITSQANAQSTAEGTARIHVLLRARFDELGLLKFTRAIESRTPPMIFESFEVHPVSGGQPAGLLEFTGMLVGFHTDAH